MKKNLGLFFLVAYISLISPLPISADNNSEGITYRLSGGRLGDNLISVAHAQWLSYCLDIPLFYKPFTHSNLLKLSEVLPLLKKNEFSKSIILDKNIQYLNLINRIRDKKNNDSTLIVVPYFPEAHNQDTRPKNPPYMVVDWDNPDFVKELKKLINPLIPIPDIEKPKDRISVAMHVRTGFGYDCAGWCQDAPAMKKWPFKFPPKDYYIDALNYLYSAVNSPLFVYIFTDHPNPTEIVEEFTSLFKDFNILFKCREVGNSHNANVIEDFFAMGEFECLIRNGSNYSFMASKIATSEILIYPEHYKLDEKNNIFFDQIMIEFRNKKENNSIKVLMKK